MSPYILLKIEGFIPNIYYRPDDGMSRKMTQLDENLFEVMIKAVNALELQIQADTKNRNAVYEELLNLASESDEFYLKEFSDISPENIEFNIENLVAEMLEHAKKIDEEYKGVEMNEETRNAIDQNQKADIFASILESIYLRLIVKTLIAASDLGVGIIHLDDKHKNPRLADQMKKELDKMGVELVIE